MSAEHADRALRYAHGDAQSERTSLGEVAIAEQLARIADALEAALPMLERLTTPVEEVRVEASPDAQVPEGVTTRTVLATMIVDPRPFDRADELLEELAARGYRLEITRSSRDALRCPTCGERSGSPCRSGDGDILAFQHPERRP